MGHTRQRTAFLGTSTNLVPVPRDMLVHVIAANGRIGCRPGATIADIERFTGEQMYAVDREERTAKVTCRTCQKVMGQNTRLPNLFREGSRTVTLIRWLIEKGDVLKSELATRREELGGSKLMTHAFDRYLVGKQSFTHYGYSPWVPRDGSYNVIEDYWKTEMVLGRKVRQRRVRWLGSEGATFFDRARNWVARLSDAEKDAALMFFERQINPRDGVGLIDSDNTDERDRAFTWIQAINAA